MSAQSSQSLPSTPVVPRPSKQPGESFGEAAYNTYWGSPAQHTRSRGRGGKRMRHKMRSHKRRSHKRRSHKRRN